MTNTNQDNENFRDIYMSEKSARENARKADRAIPKLIGSAGAIALVLGLLVISISNSVNVFTLGLSGLGLLLLVIFAALDFKNVTLFMKSRETVYTTNLTIVLVTLFGILVIVNAVASHHYMAFDLTKEKNNTLSGQTKKIIDDLNSSGRKLDITVFMRNDDPRRLQVIALMDRYQHFASNMSYTFVDYEIKKKLAVDKGVDRSCILVESDSVSQFTYDFDERNITSALVRLLHPDQKIVGLLTGHGELSPGNSGGRSISQLVEYLEKENYITKALNLATEGSVPLEMSVVLIIAPNKPLNEKEITALTEFAKRGGSVAIFLEPYLDHGLEPLLAEMGIEDLRDMVVDEKENYFQEVTTPVLKTYNHHPITDGFLTKQAAEGGYVGGLIVPTATSLKLLAQIPSDVKVEPLAYASDMSWGETSSENLLLSPEEDHEGPVMVAAVGAINYPTDEVSEAVSSNFLVVGDADFLTDASLKEGSNFDFILNSVNWLSAQETLIGEHIQLAQVRRIDLEPSQVKAVQIVNLLLPMMIAVLGVVMWIRRR